MVPPAHDDSAHAHGTPSGPPRPARPRRAAAARVPALVLALLIAAPALAGCMDLFGTRTVPGPGAWAAEFLSDETYTELIVEVDWVQGQRPSDSAIALLKQRAEERLSKPGGVTVIMDGSFPSQDDRYSTEELFAIEQDHRSRHKEGQTAVLYALFVDGRSERDEGDRRVLGVAYTASSFAIYRESIEAVAGNILATSASEIERAVVVHELGHVLGLVNIGLPMCQDHEDPEHKGHSTNSDSVMYWAVESSAIGNLLQGRSSPPTQFDADDRCDMRQAGGK